MKIYSINKMLSALLLGLFLAAPAFAAAPPVAEDPRLKPASFTTGEDWVKRMSLREKFMSVVAPMALYHQYGVPFQHAAEEYIPAIDRMLEYNPQLGGEDVANIFASTVYRLEPTSRPAFDKLEDDFLRGEYGPEVRLHLVDGVDSD